MNWWPLVGIKNRLTEKLRYKTEEKVSRVLTEFKKSLFIYPIDVGNANDLNLEMAALQSPQYNLHRFGIYFSDSPRHADVLLVLGKVIEPMIPPFKETISQLPYPYGIIIVERASDTEGVSAAELGLENVVAFINDYREPSQIISLLLNLMGAEQQNTSPEPDTSMYVRDPAPPVREKGD